MEISPGLDAEKAAPGAQEGLSRTTVADFPVWQGGLRGAEPGGADQVEVRFVGRGPGTRPTPIEELPERLGLRGIERLAWAKQVHSARMLAVPAGAPQGSCGEGDGLVSAERGVALAVVTADCVPVLLAAPWQSGGPIAAVHAGWRGVVAGIVAEAVRKMDAPPADIAAWVGPAVGACCYEVGEDVARQIVAAAREEEGNEGPRVLHPRPRGARPHVDVAAAVIRQLEAAGVRVAARATDCTFCSGGGLASYRREGKGAGRNAALIWRPA